MRGEPEESEASRDNGRRGVLNSEDEEEAGVPEDRKLPELRS